MKKRQVIEEQDDYIPENAPIRSSELLKLPGVGAATAEKLAMTGYDTMLSIAVATPGEIIEASGLTELAARKVINAARENMEMGFESADEVLKRRENITRIKTGSAALDNLLGGGFETGAITECFGAYGAGKSQLAHTLCVNLQKLNPEYVAVFIDTESTFRPERINQISKEMLHQEQVLKNIKTARAFNSDHQMLLTEKVEDLIKKGMNVKLVIVDSLTAHFRAEFVGRGTLADRQQKLNKHMHSLMKLATTYNLCVYVTNQVMAKPDVFFGDPTEAIGGHIVSHNSTYRVYLRRGKKGSRVAKLVDSPNLPEAECAFMVDETGVRDL
ncbi:DNA repair and recombination protein RadA [Candidatus Woesearchaeota archaeon]|nr:DNA repair and recombination protein RadA [Candidatus Woesearchaeota archaeon]